MMQSGQGLYGNHITKLEFMEMMSRFNRTRCTLIAILCTLFCVTIADAKPSLKDYGTLPEIQLITISPSSNLVAFRKLLRILKADDIALVRFAGACS